MYDKILVFVALSIMTSGLLIVTILAYMDDDSAFAKYKKSQTITQVNKCGNYILPTNITCSNSNSQDQGGNSVNSAETISVLPFP
jgi:hypothetical protein